jgi:hypothetical protein
MRRTAHEGLSVVTWLRTLWVHGGYAGRILRRIGEELRPKLECRWSSAPTPASGFKVTAAPRVVERTFGWLMRQRLRMDR